MAENSENYQHCTCISCHVSFANSTLQRDHYKSDWHRYNLKRKLTNLPPVTLENFNERAKLFQENQNEAKSATSSNYCIVCQKCFQSENALKSHIASKKHQERARQTDQEPITPTKPKPEPMLISKEETEEPVVEEDENSDWSDCSDDAEEEMEVSFDVKLCLFCSKKSSTLEKNIEHMTLKHSFFVPDLEFLVDPEGLVEFLGAKVFGVQECLWCHAKHFNSPEAVQKHMLDKGHCKMHFEGESVVDFADFYDFSTSYPDQDADGEGDEQSTDSFEPMSVGEDWGLRLPSGAIVGHRSLAHYYKQNLKEKKPKQAHGMLPWMMSHYRSLGWKGGSREMAKVKAKDINFVKRLHSKQFMRLGVKHNKLQHHFRQQILF